MAVSLIVPAVVVGQSSPPSSRPAKSSLEGSVVNAEGGEPIRKANVQAISETKTQGEPAVYAAISDGEGHFKIDPIDPGRYRIFVEKTGFIDVDRHRRRSEGVEVTLEVGKPLKDFVVRAVPAAAVTGRVLDEDGDPMPNVGINVLRVGYSSCRPQLDTERSETTNDLGEYRVGGLAPGKYYISATPVPGYTSVRDAANRDTPPKPEMVYTTTYYPGVIDPSQASSVQLHAGETLPLDFSLNRTASFRIRGRVANINVVSSRASDVKSVVILTPLPPDVMVREGEIDADGYFEVRGVPPGTYRMSAFTADGGSSAKTIEVSTTDLTNLQLTVESRSAIRGTLRVEGLRGADLSGFHVFVRPAIEDIYMGAIGSDDGRVKPDGSFGLSHVPPGTYRLILRAPDSRTSTYFIKELHIAGREVADALLHVGSEPVSVEVLASSAAATAEGSVTDRDQPVPNATVVAVPSPARRGVPEHYQTTLTDQTGRFRFTGLRPDDYTFLAWDDVESGAWCDPDFLKAYESAGEHAHVGENDRQTIRLKLIVTITDSK